MYSFISSFNAKLYHEYGHNFLSSWQKNCGPDIKLYIFFEGEGIEEVQKDFQSESIIIQPIDSPLLNEFKLKFGQFKEANGFRFDISPENKLSMKYNYRYDAMRFSFKAFSIYRAVFEFNIKNKIAWIDSDVICKKYFDIDSLTDIFPDQNEISSYLGRSSFPKPNAYSECGFVGYNLDHKDAINFLSEFINLYLNGDIFRLIEWHDCMAYDYVRSQYESQGHAFKNLSGEFTTSDHPFILTKLGDFFDHLKGPVRKQRGFS